MELFGRLASLRADFTVCMQPSFEKDGEALRKFLQFDTKVNILRGNKAGKAPSSFVICCSELSDCKTTLLLPTPMAVSQLYASIAQQ